MVAWCGINIQLYYFLSDYPVLTPYIKYSLFQVIWEVTSWWPKMTLTPLMLLHRVYQGWCSVTSTITLHSMTKVMGCHPVIRDATEDSVSLHCCPGRSKGPRCKWPFIKKSPKTCSGSESWNQPSAKNQNLQSCRQEMSSAISSRDGKLVFP